MGTGAGASLLRQVHVRPGATGAVCGGAAAALRSIAGSGQGVSATPQMSSPIKVHLASYSSSEGDVQHPRLNAKKVSVCVRGGG